MHWRQNSNYKEDCDFIKNMTARMSKRLDLVNNYSVYWSEMYEKEITPHKKENHAIKQSNTRLREMVKSSMQGEEIPTITPPVICGNCEYLDINNMCARFKQQVPNEFIDKENDCAEYKNGVPF